MQDYQCDMLQASIQGQLRRMVRGLVPYHQVAQRMVRDKTSEIVEAKVWHTITRPLENHTLLRSVRAAQQERVHGSYHD